MWTHWRNMKEINPQLGTEISRQEPERKCKGNRWEPYWKALVVWFQALAVRCQVVSCIMEAQFRVTKNDTEYLFCFSKTACVIGRQNLGGCGKLSKLTASLFSIGSPYFTAIADGRLRSSFSGSNSSLWPWTGTGTRHYLWWKSCTRDEVLVSSEKSGRPDSWVRVRYGIGSYIDITQNMLYAISRIHNGHKVVVCFRHATPSHYHHYAWLLACVEHEKCLPGISCRECV